MLDSISKAIATYEQLENYCVWIHGVSWKLCTLLQMLFAMFEAYVGVAKGGGVITSVR